MTSQAARAADRAGRCAMTSRPQALHSDRPPSPAEASPDRAWPQTSHIELSASPAPLTICERHRAVLPLVHAIDLEV